MVKRYIRDLLINPVLAPAVRRWRSPATVLMLHRFGTDQSDGEVMTASALRSILTYLRRERIPVISLSSMLAELSEGRPPRKNAVVFTVDDGYADFLDVAAPVFSEFDCPATVFVTTGVVDRDTWFWWDRLTHAFVQSDWHELSLEVGGRRASFSWSNRREAQVQAQALADELKRLPNLERLDAVNEACSVLGVDTTGVPPEGSRVMTWDEIRGLAAGGAITFGPHTVTHPVLSRLSTDEMRFEIVESHRRMREMVPETIPVFAYPNGKEGDYSRSTIDVLKEADITAAVSTEPQHLASLSAPDDIYVVPRLGCPPEMDAFVQIVSGVEVLKTSLRSRLRAG
jgi:peptidoglycan/xylan/chitin deacetylase (PgdA/CDA1 family)